MNGKERLPFRRFISRKIGKEISDRAADSPLAGKEFRERGEDSSNRRVKPRDRNSAVRALKRPSIEECLWKQTQVQLVAASEQSRKSPTGGVRRPGRVSKRLDKISEWR